MRWFIIKVIALLLILNFVIVVHELGHLLVGKAFGISTLSFNVGLGTPIAEYSGPETNYYLRAIPLGGYVEYFDRDKYDPAEMQRYREAIQNEFPQRAAMLGDSSRDIKNASRWKVFLVLLAGPFVNLAIANRLRIICIMIRRRELKRMLSPNAPGNPIDKLEEFLKQFGGLESGSAIGKKYSRADSRSRFRSPLGGPITVIRQLWMMLDPIKRRPLHTLLIATGRLSFGLGFINLFPIPPLDGGRIALLLMEGGIAPQSTLTLLITAMSLFIFTGLVLWGDGAVVYGWVKQQISRLFKRR